jgi:hypothetical protein
MSNELMNMVASIVGLISGGLIGAGFGAVQELARRRYQRLQRGGKFNNVWAAIPGSGMRIAFLLLALVLVQVICPLLFTQGAQWWVSGGVVAGYGAMLFRQLAQRQAGRP